MKPSLTIMDFLILLTMMTGVAIAAHYCLTHKQVNAAGEKTSESKPTWFGGAE